MKILKNNVVSKGWIKAMTISGFLSPLFSPFMWILLFISIKEGVMSTVLGDIHYLHIAKFNYEDPDRIDAWLAKDYGYLPIKIAVTQDDLSVINNELEVLNIEQ